MKNKILMLISIILAFVSLLTISISFANDYEGHWAEEAIETLKENGIIQGDENGNINPNNSITRAEFIKIVNRTMKFNEKGTEQYADIIGNEWYAEEFLIAKKAGYIQGDENRNANPQNDITRAEVSVVLSRILSLSSNEKMGFADEQQLPTWAYQSISGLVNAGIINGYEDNTFKANNSITRAEAITLINRIMQRDEEKDIKDKKIKELKEKGIEIVQSESGGGKQLLLGKVVEGTVNNEQDLQKLIKEVKLIYGIKSIDEFKIEKIDEERYLLKQIYNGIEVYNGYMVIILNSKKEITGINGNYIKDINISTIPELNKEKIIEKLEDERNISIISIDLIIYTENNKNILAWNIQGLEEENLIKIYIDAKNGTILKEKTDNNVRYLATDAIGINGEKVTINTEEIQEGNYRYLLKGENFNIFAIPDYNAAKKEIVESSDGSLVFELGGVKIPFMTSNNKWLGKLNIEDPIFEENMGKTVVTVYDNAEKTIKFYKDNLDFNKDKYKFFVDVKGPKNNSSHTLVLGNSIKFGLDESENSMGLALDVVGHEFTHIVLSYKNDYSYDGEESNNIEEIEEAYCDIMGELIQIHYGKNKEEWILGDTINTIAKRNVKDPESMNLPASINSDNYYDDPKMKELLYHNNSTVLSHTAYLMYDRGIKDEVKLAQLWYGSMKYLTKGSDYQEVRAVVLQSAKELNFSESEIEIIKKAFDEVGVLGETALEFNIYITDVNGKEECNKIAVNDEETVMELNTKISKLKTENINDKVEYYIEIKDIINDKWDIVENEIYFGKSEQDKYISDVGNITIRLKDSKNSKKVIKNILIKTTQIRPRIAFIIAGQEYKGTKNNPLISGAYLTWLEVENKTGKVVKEWELWNEVDKKYDSLSMSDNNIGIVIETKNYIDVLNNFETSIKEGEYAIRVKCIFVDETSLEEELYIKLVKISEPYEKQEVKLDINSPAFIRWNGDMDKEYFIRIVEYDPENNPDEAKEEIISGIILKGREYPMPLYMMKKGSNYRLAIKAKDGIYYDIVHFKYVE